MATVGYWDALVFSCHLKMRNGESVGLYLACWDLCVLFSWSLLDINFELDTHVIDYSLYLLKKSLPSGLTESNSNKD